MKHETFENLNKLHLILDLIETRYLAAEAVNCQKKLLAKKLLEEMATRMDVDFLVFDKELNQV